MCDGMPGDEILDINHSVTRLEILTNAFIDLFQGQGSTLIEQLEDAHAKASSVMTALDGFCARVGVAAPYLLEPRDAG